MVFSRAARLIGATIFSSLAAGSALAQSPVPAPKPKPAPDRCLALSEAPGVAPRVMQAAVRLAQATSVTGGLKPGEARLTYIGHSTFLIESAKGVTISTDYNDIYRAPLTPDIATMNLAHETHHSYVPQAGIKHILRGWNPSGGAAIHDLSHEDVRVRNIPTNIRTWSGDDSGGRFGNSIFIFELAGLCIAHLGHLHHTLTVQHLAQIGQMDVVLVPVDGSYTLDVPGMMEVLKALKAPLIVPMHYFSRFTLERFLSEARKVFEVVESPVPTTVLSRANLPARQRVLVLPGG
ncbi:MAG: MBL fold metallo-hydrolase [Hyphomicrobiaceae bacterium]